MAPRCCTSVAWEVHVGTGGAWRTIEKIFDARPNGTPVVSYTVHGSTVFNPAASKGAVSRVATIMPLAEAVAAM